MTVPDDLALLASLLPPPLRARYRVQLMWAADVNKDIGFKFSLRKELHNGGKNEDRDLQLRDFNLASINQSSAATACVLNAEEGFSTPESQKPNPGRHDIELKNPEILFGNGNQQGFNAEPELSYDQEKRKCDECSWEGRRKAYGNHKKRVHGTRPKLTKCENCGIKRCTLFSHKCRAVGKISPRPGMCGTCGFRASNLVSHILLRHSRKELYLKEHYNVERNEELTGGHNCHDCGKHLTNKRNLWRHICSLHGVVTQEEIDHAAMGKVVVEEKSLEEDQTMKKLGSNVSRPAAAAASEGEHRSGNEKQLEEKEKCNEGKGLSSAGENKEEARIDRDEEKRARKRKKERKALREVSPACDYERIRAANIAERMELLRRIDMEGAVAGAKEGSL